MLLLVVKMMVISRGRGSRSSHWAVGCLLLLLLLMMGLVLAGHYPILLLLTSYLLHLLHMMLLLLLTMRWRWYGRKRTELDVVAAATVMATNWPTQLQLAAAPATTGAACTSTRDRYRRNTPDRHGRQGPLATDGSRCGSSVAAQTQILIEARPQPQQYVGRGRIGVVLVVGRHTDDPTPHTTTGTIVR